MRLYSEFVSIPLSQRLSQVFFGDDYSHRRSPRRDIPYFSTVWTTDDLYSHRTIQVFLDSSTLPSVLPLLVLDSLVVQNLVETVLDLDEVLLVLHHLVDVLVGLRVLVDETCISVPSFP